MTFFYFKESDYTFSSEHMKKAFPMLLVAASILAGCTSVRTLPRQSTVTYNRLFQFSVIPALQRGVFDDSMFSGVQLKQKGDFGLGTFNALDGELILLNDTVYQAKSDGKVALPPNSFQSPFAVACFFHADTTFAVAAVDQQQLYAELEKIFSPNYIYAIKVSGSFDSMVVRSVAAQKKPYTTLATAAAAQSVFAWKRVTGELVSFFSPQYMTGLNVPGFHSHFISDDRQRAGHVLRFSGASLTVSIARIQSLDIQFPSGGDFKSVNLFDIDPNDIHKAEK
jgi:acetolactate decarboxylase